MNNYQLEQLENIRRAVEQDLKVSEDLEDDSFIDSFLHILNLVELIKANDGSI